jgi:tripartite-type tricarboxylate transporter receptor subunit TctC
MKGDENEKMANFLVGVWAYILVFIGGIQGQEKYPNRPIELVVPFGPGGVADVVARIYSEDLSRVLNVPITVVNRAGGAGIQGTIYVIRARKDGYTLLATPRTPIILPPVITPNEAPYNPLKDLINLGQFGSVPHIFGVKSDSPYQKLEDLIEHARKNPGKLKNSSVGMVEEGVLNLEILCARNKIKIPSIPFKSGAESMTALLGGHVDMTSSTLTIQGPQIKAGKTRGLTITSKTRHPDFPDIPTTAELGYPEVNIVTWFSAFAPAGVPQPILNVLIPAFEKVIKNPEVTQRLTKASLMVEYKDPVELQKIIESDLRIVEKVAQDANLIKK